MSHFDSLISSVYGMMPKYTTTQYDVVYDIPSFSNMPHIDRTEVISNSNLIHTYIGEEER